MVLLDAARQGIKAHGLAYMALGLGIAATLAANVAAGLSYGPVGALVASWPAPALVISYELLMIVLRSSVRAAAPAPPSPAVLEPPAELNGHGHAATERYADDLAAGKVPGIRRIRRDLKAGQPRAQQVQAYLSALARVKREVKIMPHSRRRSSYYRPMSRRRLRRYLWWRPVHWPLLWLFGWH